jgi:hypothetical protein
MTDEPNTQAPEAPSFAVVQRISAEQKLALERGDAIAVLTRRVPIAVVDFYPEEAPA